ncbi:MAG: SxtJ family membrane protein [Candidatus Paceibacterota bacterium]|jgi:hypothetical protein
MMFSILYHRVRDEISAIDASSSKLRQFGLFVGGILAVAGLFMYLKGALPVWLFIGIVLIALGVAIPIALRYPYYAWMALAAVLGLVVAPVVLTALFYLLLTPIGLLQRVFGTDPLARRFEPGAASYWKKKQVMRAGHMRNPF